jgi:hypothetical protein
MAIGSQAAAASLLSELTGLTHDIFVGRVVNNVRRESPTSMLFQNASPGEYRLEGQKMNFAVDLRFKTGALATDGKLPDHTAMDAVQGYITPIRRYARLALDNLVEKQASGPGAFDNLSDRVFDLLWDSWKSMEIRHSIGAASGALCKVTVRASTAIVDVYKGYGHTGTNPIMHLSEGSILGWWDVSASLVGGAGTVGPSGIDYATNRLTMGAAWEVQTGTSTSAIAADDVIYFATTPDPNADYFTLERNLAPNGLGTIVDPDAAASTVFNISESTYPRWKPFRKASSTFDHIELTEHWLQLAAKRGFGVTPATDVVVTFPANVAQIARSLMGFQQQAYAGADLKGGYRTVTVSGIPIVEDHFFYHDVAMTLNKDSLYRINLGADADFWGEDGSMWQRITDFDGKEAFVVDYMNTFCNARGANGALTGITTDLTTAAWDSVPNY